MLTQPAESSKNVASSGMRWTSFAWRTAVVAALVTLTILACMSRQESDKTSEAGVVMKLPKRVGNFTGEPQEMSEAEKNLLPGDTELVRMKYTNPAGEYIVESIVLSGGEKRSIHRPEICLPGQGWTITGREVLPIKLASGKIMDVMNLSLSQEVVAPDGTRHNVRGYFVYWFVGDERTTASQVERFLVTAWDRLHSNINHRWAYVIVSGLIEDSVKPGGKNEKQTMAMVENFIRESVPAFQKNEMIGEISVEPTNLQASGK